MSQNDEPTVTLSASNSTAVPALRALAGALREQGDREGGAKADALANEFAAWRAKTAAAKQVE